MVLENPVAETPKIQQQIVDFDSDCKRKGLRVAYYRVPQNSIALYKELDKKFIPIGEEAIVDLTNFNLEKSGKSHLRKTVNKLMKTGYMFKIYEAPQKDAFLQQLKSVSNDWLEDMKLTEIVFSQGIFSEKELKNQCI